MKKFITVLLVILFSGAVLSKEIPITGAQISSRLLELKSCLSAPESLNQDRSVDELFELRALVDYLILMNTKKTAALNPVRERFYRCLGRVLGAVRQVQRDQPRYLLRLYTLSDQMIDGILLENAWKQNNSADYRSVDAIIGNALGAVGDNSHVYGVLVHTGITGFGKAASAAVVSVILKKSGHSQEVITDCGALRDYLESRQGWNRVGLPEYEPGDVFFRGVGREFSHAGIVVGKDLFGEWWTVDNSPTLKKVVKRPILGSYGQEVVAAYRVPGSRQ
ncbi:MAG: hypothetical protein PHW04_06760 [Candidatus Wallbacteria bacterium]|nr:hypothetical protein [Candidatus Wallbacteria bacterium]